MDDAKHIHHVEGRKTAMPLLIPLGARHDVVNTINSTALNKVATRVI